MVGDSDHDNGGVRRYGAQDVRRDVRRSPVRPGRSADHLPARTRHRFQLFHVLQSHTGSHHHSLHFLEKKFKK